eukprot:CAMPEP_0172164680 /NCGR_PEP_ID=MMETSP1050-20130122/7982_1 /TAXON_ID=233186 /ORGANISM="Cryptomonas curvata, Strain CCAP979/52" /LENGTH=123 /DNA_ID=CAMNT_0012835049 /DNA_START=86 /DNA_END=454 /DNA_ORIENTATION=+
MVLPGQMSSLCQQVFLEPVGDDGNPRSLTHSHERLASVHVLPRNSWNDNEGLGAVFDYQFRPSDEPTLILRGQPYHRSTSEARRRKDNLDPLIVFPPNSPSAADSTTSANPAGAAGVRGGCRL